MPSKVEYLRAFQFIFEQNKINDLGLAILKEQYWSPNQCISAIELSSKLHKPLVTINKNYGSLGRMIADEIGYVPEQRREGTFRWWTILSKGWRSSEKKFIWQMHTEVVQALDEIGMLLRQADEYEEKIPEVDVLIEGAVRQIKINSYERNSVARQRCIEHYGAKCIVCGFDFEKVYGKYGENYIHVHHLLPLSEINKEYHIDPVKDLRPVCPNCHAIIHRKNPPLTICEIRQIVKNNTQLEFGLD